MRNRRCFCDLDGTLVDSRPGIFAGFRAGLAAVGGKAPDDKDLQRFLGTPLPLMFQAVVPTIDATGIDRAIAAFRDTYQRAGLAGHRLYDGVVPMLRALRDGGDAVWIVTSKPQPQAERIVALLDIAPLIGGIVGAGLAETDTKTELVARALAATGADPGATVMLGDRHYDVTGARENGVAAAGALWGYGSRAELAAAGCRWFADSPLDFLDGFTGNERTAAAR